MFAKLAIALPELSYSSAGGLLSPVAIVFLLYSIDISDMSLREMVCMYNSIVGVRDSPAS